jgi:hypothetical protein
MSGLANRYIRTGVAVPGMATFTALAAGCLALAAWGLASYPLPVWPLAATIAAYAAALWRWPSLFLLILPVFVPAYDLGLWTGWMAVGESDLFIAVTVAVLLIRAPPTAQDLRPTGACAVILAAFAVSWLIATVVGLTSPLGAAPSDNAFLRPDNALRLFKPLAETLALLPFLRRRQRTHGDVSTRIGWGLTASLAVVTVIVLAERILFASIFDASTAYRVAGPFSSMRVGGGHIGAYAALVLPFTLTVFQLRPRWCGTVLALAACVCGGYTLAVTFARTAYAACLLGMAVTATGCLFLATRNRSRSAVLWVAPVAAVLAAVLAVAGLTGMHTRFAASGVDFLIRQDNWRAGLAVRDDGVPATLFGMGLGTYQRAMLERSPVNRPSDIVLRADSAGPYVSIRIETPFYLGQKITLPSRGRLSLTLRARAPDGVATLGILVCDKMLLYADNCRGTEDRLTTQWATFHTTIPSDGLGETAVNGLLRRPVELAVAGPIGHMIEIRDISVTDEQGTSLLANGDFTHGLDRWIFTDDSHVSYRMLNAYLMLFFETGIFGVTAYVALAILAFAGGIRALRSGSLAGASIIGAVTAFLISGLSDNVLEAPRLAILFFLICCCGLIEWDDAYTAPRNSAAKASHS